MATKANRRKTYVAQIQSKREYQERPRSRRSFIFIYKLRVLFTTLQLISLYG